MAKKLLKDVLSKLGPLPPSMNLSLQKHTETLFCELYSAAVILSVKKFTTDPDIKKTLCC